MLDLKEKQALKSLIHQYLTQNFSNNSAPTFKP